MDIKTKDLEAVAYTSEDLASNYGEVARDCYGLDGATFASELQNRFPLVTWLLNTPMSNDMRRRAGDGLISIRKDAETGKHMLQIPRSIWTTTPASTKNECCWVPFDFAKCAGEVPLNLLCLKDCDDILDIFVSRTLRIGSRDSMPPIAYRGETLEQVNDRIARMSMAFLTAYNLILGIDNTYTNILKPFHGLLAVMENPAVATIDGSSILGAFDEVACRLAVLGFDDVVFAGHPLIIDAIRKEVRPDINGRYPDGWEVRDGNIYFYGARFISDKLVPYSVANGTGEIWMLSGDSVGAFLGTDLIPTEAFRKSGYGFDAETCGTECRYYYNFGSAFNNNANKLAVITDIPVSVSCANAISDLAGLVVPQTLIPNA